MNTSKMNTIKEQVENMVMADASKPAGQRTPSSFLYADIYNTILNEYELTEREQLEVTHIVNDYLI